MRTVQEVLQQPVLVFVRAHAPPMMKGEVAEVVPLPLQDRHINRQDRAAEQQGALVQYQPKVRMPRLQLCRASVPQALHPKSLPAASIA